jgi:hypothetical protein
LDQLSQAGIKKVDGELYQLDEPLQEYVRLLQSLKAAVKRRSERRQAYALSISDVEAKQVAYNKVQGTGKDEVERQKQAAVEKAQSTCDSNKEEYERVSKELLVEYEQFKSQKANDLKEILTNWVNTQVRDSFYLLSVAANV